MTIQITPAIAIDDAELEERFVRASGPGGQNVNKVATAVQLRFDVARSTSLSDDVKGRLRAIAGTRMTDDGVLVIDSREFRTQSQNRNAARERLTVLIRKALVVPRRRRKTKPTKHAKQERIASKKHRGQVKATRGRIQEED